MPHFPIAPEVASFIEQHQQKSSVELALLASKYPDIPMNFVIDQVVGRKKAKEKLPSWTEQENVVYPPKLSMEQCSSELTAQFKASLVEGELLIDLTGGFGVDDAFFAAKMQKLVYLEQNQELGEIVQYNFQQLGITNASFHFEPSIEFLENFGGIANWIYLDPARRDQQKNKVVGFEDCQPNVLDNLPLLLAKGKNILIKASPMLDLKQAVRQLKHVHKIWIVSVQNECKELLFLLNSEVPPSEEIHCVNITATGQNSFTSDWEQETVLEVELSMPKQFIYEPNASIMKAGLFRSLASQLGLAKLHAHSHLFTSDELIKDFPGRAFECEKVVKFNKKELLKLLPEKKVNITVRNFPLTVAEIRKKTGLKDGGDQYLLATTNMDGNKICLLCKKR